MTATITGLQTDLTQKVILDAAIRLLAQHAKQVAEGAGAASLAAAIKVRDQLRGKKVVGILTGGNIPPDRFAATIT